MIISRLSSRQAGSLILLLWGRKEKQIQSVCVGRAGINSVLGPFEKKKKQGRNYRKKVTVVKKRKPLRASANQYDPHEMKSNEDIIKLSNTV